VTARTIRPPRTPATQRRQEALAGWGFVLPYALGMLVFVLGPLIAVLAISLTNWSLLDTPKYVGAANYLKLASDRDFLSSLAVTGFFTLGILLLNITAALVLANLMNLRLPGIGAFRTVVFSPVVMPVWPGHLSGSSCCSLRGPSTPLSRDPGCRTPTCCSRPARRWVP